MREHITRFISSQYFGYLSLAVFLMGVFTFSYGIFSSMSARGRDKETQQQASGQVDASDQIQELPKGESAGEHATPSASLQVYVSGAVKNPGVYGLAEGSRVKDGIELAGGFEKNADPNRIARELNLAQKIHDQDHIHVSAKEDISMLNGGNSTATSNSLLDVNSATLAQLEELTGIGEVTAKKIVSLRPYLSFQDFAEKTGLSTRLLDGMKAQITFYTGN
ncbi:MAG: ComEA family DNA-binding protein [Patescibacteria group bacterium]